jgi:ankyrin repeat protein
MNSRASTRGWREQTGIRGQIWGLLGFLAIVIAVGVIFLLWVRTTYGVSLVDVSASGNLESVRTMLDNGGDIDKQDARRFGWTPLIAAVKHRRTNVALLLIERGANVDLVDKSGKSPLMYEVLSVAPDSVLLNALENAGANSLLKDKDGFTALEHATFMHPENVELIKILKNWKRH